MNEVVELIDYIEEFLLSFYCIKSHFRARDFLRAEDVERPYLQIMEHTHLELAIVLPKNWLDQKYFLTSVDGLSALVEEVSHFHTLIVCASNAKQVSELDLEVQGEWDKVVFLYAQYRKCGIEMNRHRTFELLSEMLKNAQASEDIYKRASLIAERELAHDFKRHSKFRRHPSLEDLRSWLMIKHPAFRRVA